MTAWQFIRHGIWHYKLSYLGVFAGAALGAAVLLGALLAGDSVKETLKEVAQNRVGKIDQIFIAGEGFFRDQLAAEVRGENLQVAPILFMQGQLSDQSSGRALGNVQILGVDDSFWQFAPGENVAVPLEQREYAINEHLASSLDLKEGQSVVLRLQEPGMLSRDAPLSGEAEDVISVRGKVRAILGDEKFGRFSLQATQLPSPTVFMPISRLQEVIDYPGKANLLLLKTETEREELLETVRSHMILEDYGFSLIDVPLAQATEIRSSRIFIEPRVVDLVRERFSGAQPVTSYLANTLAFGDEKETPYSMVTAVDASAAPFLPADLGFNDIVINSWLAEDLGAKEGDPIDMSFFWLVEGNRLKEATETFLVKKIVPLDGLAADRLWMPDFPGVAEAEDAEDWTPGLPLDLDRIRPKDEDYWDEHKGTPKAFISLQRGEALFNNRWGAHTSVRVPLAEADRATVGKEFLPMLRPEMTGILLKDLRAGAEMAAQSPVDIAGLFLSMSFFLIVAAIALTAMLFRFNVEQRNRESGLLSALGIPANKVLRWRMGEGLCIVVAGGLVGLVIAVAYSKGILGFLETIWSDDAESSLFTFHFNPVSVVMGLLLFVLLTMAVIWFTARKQARQSASLRLSAGTEEVQRGEARPKRLVVWAICCVLAGFGSMGASGAIGAQGAFFLSGTFFLVAGLLGYRAWLASSGLKAQEELSTRSLAVLNSGRRPSRSLVVVGTLACGVFLVLAVTAFQKHGGNEWKERKSGAGGFAFWIETTGAINRAADANEDPDYFEMGDDRSMLGQVLPFRMGVGDDASCFNLNKASRPRLLATETKKLEARDAFTLKVAKSKEDLAKGWALLRESTDERVLPAFIDQTTLMWVLKKKVGDRIVYQDEYGEDFEVEVVGALADSVFQGSMVVDEAALLKLFPSQEGHRLFLAEAFGDLEETRKVLQKATGDRGSTITLTKERLEAFHGVENTYIAIFHVLGGLGLLLGSAGIGIVTARNLSERRSEFRVLETIGIPLGVVKAVIFKEVRGFVGWALVVGLIAAVIAILPALVTAPPVKTLLGLGGLVLGIALNSLVWAWVGYRAGFQRTAVAETE